MTTALTAVERHSIEEFIKAEVAKQVAVIRIELRNQIAAEATRLDIRINQISYHGEGLP